MFIILNPARFAFANSVNPKQTDSIGDQDEQPIAVHMGANYWSLQ